LNLHDILCHLLVNDVHSFWWCLNNASIIHELESNPSAGNYKWVNLQPLTIWIWIFSSMFRRCKKNVSIKSRHSRPPQPSSIAQSFSQEVKVLNEYKIVQVPPTAR
jgi:hypothetical protein